MVPTTSGTGSECSSGLVVIIPDETMGKVKSFILHDDAFARMAIVDPVLCLGAPPRVTAGSGMDALAHTAESAMCLAANPFTDALAFEGVKLVADYLRTAVHQGNNIEARWQMAWAASLGGMICALPWISGPATPAHVVSESISARYGFPHGESCGLLLPFTYWFNMRDEYGRRKIAMIAEAMGEDIIGLSLKQAAEQAVTATFDLLEDVGLPTSLKEYDIPKSDLPVLLDYVLDRGINVYGMNAINPVKINKDNMREFLELAWEGRDCLGL
jgi:alcohol dehydrogenase class IV